MNESLGSVATSERIGFIGLGDIGAPMARRVLEAGVPLAVYNRTQQKCVELAAEGARRCESIAELVECSDLVLVCVSDGAAVEDVLLGQDGVASRGTADKILIDLSTIHPQTSKDLAARLQARCGMRFVDAPVSGGPSGAAAGTLAVMMGGSAADVQRASVVLRSFAGRLTHMGSIGCGQATKACNQMINIANAGVIAEAMNFARRFGIDPALLPGALAGGFADSLILSHFGPKIANGTFSGNSRITIKDMDIVLDLGRTTNSPMPVTSLLASMFRLVVSRGYLHDGLAGIARV